MQFSNMAAAVSQIRMAVFPNWQSIKEIEAYIIFDDVYSVVSKLATTAAQINFVAYDENTNEELPPTDKLSIYLKTLTLEEKEKMYTFMFLVGELFMYKDSLRLGPNKGDLKTIPMHPSFMYVFQNQVFPYRIFGYKYQDTMNTFELKPEDIIYTKLFNPSTNYYDYNRGMSPIKALAQRLTRVQANMSASVAQMQNGGVPSIVYDKTPGIDQDRGSGGVAENNDVTVMGQHKENFARFLRNPENKGAPYFAAGEMGVVELGLSLVEMDALTMAGIDFDKICNAFSVSSLLWNSGGNAKFSNVQEFRRDMWTNALIPNIKRVCDAITTGTRDIFGPGKCVRADFSGIPELQENMKEKADAWAALPAIVINEMRVAMGQDESTEELADKMIIKQGYSLLDDLNIDVQPINNAAGDYQNTGNSGAGNSAGS